MLYSFLIGRGWINFGDLNVEGKGDFRKYYINYLYNIMMHTLIYTSFINKILPMNFEHIKKC